MGKTGLPLAIGLFILLVLVTGFAAQSGMHLQDGMYRVAVDDPELGQLIAGDPRFVVYRYPGRILSWEGNSYDLIVIRGQVYYRGTDKSKAALKTVERNYGKYVNGVYNTAGDLFAAYPLWIDTQSVKSELDFLATQSGQYVSAAPARGVAPVPSGEVKEVPTPSPTLGYTVEEIRAELVLSGQQDTRISRYTEVLSSGTSTMGSFKTPAQMSPPLPFDSIILIFVFIFPLYFTSQFFMMSIMNERIERKGEILLSAPVKTSSIILGKMLPYFIGMIAICTGLTLYLDAPLLIMLPLVPVIVFFLANALMIGMLSRSFKELSFVSIFFSTVATSYLFFPSIFANVHVISLPPDPDRPHPAGHRVDAHRLPLLDLPLLAHGGGALLHRGAQLQGRAALLGARPYHPDAGVPLRDNLGEAPVPLAPPHHRVLDPVHLHGAADVPCSLLQPAHAVLACPAPDVRGAR
jgi:hypothetical protein